MRLLTLLALLLAAFLPLDVAQGAVPPDNLHYTLSQSTAGIAVWTAPPSRRVFKDDPKPEDTASGIAVQAAGNEAEPFVVVLRPDTTRNLSVSLGDFGPGVSAELYLVEYVWLDQTSDSLGRTGDYPDPLWPLEDGGTVTFQAGRNTALWITLHVAPGVAPGDRQATLSIGSLDIPVTLHVFDFDLPPAPSVRSQMNCSFQTFLQAYGVPGTGEEYWRYVDMIKQFFIDHRLTPKGPLWPGGLTTGGGGPFIDYDCNGGLSDPYGIWGFDWPADRYLNGNGFNDGAGFPSYMAATFSNNDPSTDQRPAIFCGHARSAADWYAADAPDSAYNQAWTVYMGAVQDYLQAAGQLDRAYHYMANEPQDQADYDAVAWYSKLLEQAAPDLKLMVSEEPRPEIFNHPDYSEGQIDIWLPVLHNYAPDVSWARAALGEETWIYWLYGTRPPYFNPITLDHPGIEARLTGWFLWKYRIRGIAYYSLNNWSKNPWTEPMTSGHNGDTFLFYPPSKQNQAIAYGANNHRLLPSIRLELMRDSLEDYEYLRILNAGADPLPGVATPADIQADKVVSGLTSYTRGDEFMYTLRRYIGLKNGGEIAEIPDIQPGDQGQPVDVFINFQDPDGAPSESPLVVNGREYLKIGWGAYDEAVGYGWYGDNAHVMYQYLADGPDELRSSIIYDDWGWQHTFVYDLPDGDYLVTVGVGWQGRTYSHQRIVIEAVPFVDDEATTPQTPYLTRTRRITVADGALTMEVGIFDEYTMLNFLEIRALDKGAVPALGLLLDGE